MANPNIFDLEKLGEIRAHGNDWAVISRDPRTDDETITVHETIEQAIEARKLEGGELVELMELDAMLSEEQADAEDIWRNGVA